MATPNKTEFRSDRIGIVPGAAHLALDVVDRSQSTAIGVIQDVRTELRAMIESGIELAEKTTGALFRLARKVTLRIDEGTAELLGNAERVLTGAVRTARDTTRAATDLAHTVATGVGGQPASPSAS